MVYISLGYYQDPCYVVDLLNRWLETAFKAAAEEAISNPTSGLTLPPRLLMNLHFNTKSHLATLKFQDNQPPNIRVKFFNHLAAILGFDNTHYNQSGTHVSLQLRWSPRGHILKSLVPKPQVLENCPVLGSRTALLFGLLKFCRSPEKNF